jgi:hypothetical protein
MVITKAPFISFKCTVKITGTSITFLLECTLDPVLGCAASGILVRHIWAVAGTLLMQSRALSLAVCWAPFVFQMYSELTVMPGTSFLLNTLGRTGILRPLPNSGRAYGGG